MIRYVPEFEKRWNRFAQPVNASWRVDETYIEIRGRFTYLYRAVDKHGKTVDFLLRPDRGIAAAQAFFRKALSTSLPRWPRKITLDGHLQSHMALRLLRREDPKWKYVEVRSNPYLNNIIEQDHRAIKRRCKTNLGSSIGLALRPEVPRMCPRPVFARKTKFRAPLMHQFLL